jgi:hypothetical protein
MNAAEAANASVKESMKGRHEKYNANVYMNTAE